MFDKLQHNSDVSQLDIVQRPWNRSRLVKAQSLFEKSLDDMANVRDVRRYARTSKECLLPTMLQSLVQGFTESNKLRVYGVNGPGRKRF